MLTMLCSLCSKICKNDFDSTLHASLYPMTGKVAAKSRLWWETIKIDLFHQGYHFFENETNLRSYDVKREIESINMWIAVWVFLEQHLCNWCKFWWMLMKMALKLNYHVTFSTMNLFTFEMCSEICFKNWFQCLKKDSTVRRSADFSCRDEKKSYFTKFNKRRMNSRIVFKILESEKRFNFNMFIIFHLNETFILQLVYAQKFLLRNREKAEY